MSIMVVNHTASFPFFFFKVYLFILKTAVAEMVMKPRGRDILSANSFTQIATTAKADPGQMPLPVAFSGTTTYIT